MKIVAINDYMLEEINTLKGIGVSTYDLSGIHAIYVNNILVGFSQHYIFGRYLEIDNLYILDEYQGNGIGMSFVNEIKQTYSNSEVQYITGQSKPDKVGFWLCVGAKFDVDLTDDYIEECENEYYCIPFKIKINN